MTVDYSRTRAAQGRGHIGPAGVPGVGYGVVLPGLRLRRGDDVAAVAADEVNLAIVIPGTHQVAGAGHRRACAPGTRCDIVDAGVCEHGTRTINTTKDIQPV